METLGEVQYERQRVDGEFTGLAVGMKSRRRVGTRAYWLEISYALGVIGREKLRTGGALGKDGLAWSRITSTLPEAAPTDAGGSVALDFSLSPGEAKTVRFVLAWYAPRWHGQQGDGTGRQRCHYFHRYGSRFGGALEVAEYLAQNHKELLRRVLGWQQVVYAEESLPDWLRDSLLNVLTVFAQNSFWVHVPQGSSEQEHWFGSEGLFSVNESIVSCPQPSCTPCEWLGNLPLVYFFPDLVRLNLRAFRHYQRASGEAPFSFGLGTDMESPWYGDGAIDSDHAQDGSYYIQMVDRLWQRTGDDDVLREFYRSVVSEIDFMKSLDRDGDGLVGAREDNYTEMGVEALHRGAVTYTSGLWLATLRIAERMAEAMGDHSFARDCKAASSHRSYSFWGDIRPPPGQQ